MPDVNGDSDFDEELFEMTPAAGALDIAAGSPGQYTLRGLYGAPILGAGKDIAV